MSSAAHLLPLRSATAARSWSVSQKACLAAALAALVWHALLLTGYALRFGDASALVCVDGTRIGRPPYEAIRVGFGYGGFDGQFYYTLARNPWRLWQEPIDAPAYRHARI